MPRVQSNPFFLYAARWFASRSLSLARIRAARRLAMAMAEKLPRRRSSLIFSIHPFPGSVEQTTAALALLNANGEFRYVSSLPGGPAKRESPRRCSDHANPACLGGESTRHDRSFEC